MPRKKDARMPTADVAPMGSDLVEEGDRPWFLAQCTAAGMSKTQAASFWARIHEQGVISEFDASDENELVKEFDKKIEMVLGYIDPTVARVASIKDLTGALSVLFDKRQLAKGKPTSIISIDDRRAIQDVHKKLIEEMERRKMHVVEMKETEDG